VNSRAHAQPLAPVYRQAAPQQQQQVYRQAPQVQQRPVLRAQKQELIKEELEPEYPSDVRELFFRSLDALFKDVNVSYISSLILSIISHLT
jgi:hypothetical protein